MHDVMNEFNEMISGSKPTLVDFFAVWCGPCKMQGPVIDQVKSEVGDKANVIKIDVDRNPQLSTQYRIQSVPTLILFRNGEIMWRGYGVHQKDQLIAKIDEFANDNNSQI